MWLMLQWNLRGNGAGVNPEAVSRKSVPSKGCSGHGSPKLAACQAGHLSARRAPCGLELGQQGDAEGCMGRGPLYPIVRTWGSL